VSSLKSDVKLKIDYSKIARFSLDAKKLELVSSGLNNIWGFQLRGNGQWYGSEANDLGYSVAPMEPGTGFPGIGNERLSPYQPFMPTLHEFRVGGTGISGTAFADDASGSFPEEYKNVAFLANPITSSVNAVRIVRNPDGSVTAKHLPDLLTSEDDWFRPVNMEFGPDGSLYIADWYNKIISHNELPTTHPDRDKSHGRIWRIRHVSQKPRVILDFNQVKTEELVNYLKSPSIWEKRAAWHQISDRPISETKGLAMSLMALATNESQDEVTRIHALWSLEGIKHYDATLLSLLLKSPLHDLRREAVRSLASFYLNTAQIASSVKELIEDKNPAVRSQVLRTLLEVGGADQSVIDILVRASKPEIPGNAMGGAYERKFERFLARRALEQYSGELQTYLNAPIATDIPVANILWAIQALPVKQKETAFLKFWPTSNITALDESAFIGIAEMLGNKEIYEAVKSVFQNPVHASAYTQIALQNQARLQSTELTQMLLVPISTLLKSESQPNIDLALDAIGRFKIDKMRDAITSLINDQTPDQTLKLTLKALEINPKASQEVFKQIVQNKKLSFEVRVAALNSLSKASPTEGEMALLKWLPELKATEKAEMVSILAGSNQSAAVLMNVFGQKGLDLSAFNLSSAERIVNANRSDQRGQAIMEGVKKREEEKKKAFDGELKRYMVIANKNGGNPNEGKKLFQTCLLCHQVGNKGQNIAPALDGSASREYEALLTAILNPDAAVESSYAIYRVKKKDGQSLEGYLVNKDARGTTLAFMGGSRVFIETANIQNQGFLGGRSFMTKGLIDNYTDKQVADLLSYIRTLK
jgi:putative heme-binding domain-containing protein